jgi:hypothetical protein
MHRFYARASLCRSLEHSFGWLTGSQIMHNDRIASTSLRWSSDSQRCNPVMASIALRFSADQDLDATDCMRSGREFLSISSSTDTPESRLARAVSRSLSRRSGHLAQAMVLPGGRMQYEAVVQFVRGSRTAAAVLLLDMSALFHTRGCDWRTALLRTRNRMSDEGFKVYALLSDGRQHDGLAVVLHKLRDRYTKTDFAHYCDTNGIGFLSSNQLFIKERDSEVQATTVSTIVTGLMSARHFCCGAFPIADSRHALLAV